jgi:hypothetical protein
LPNQVGRAPCLHLHAPPWEPPPRPGGRWPSWPSPPSSPALVAIVFVGRAGVAGAQDGDPYGETTTTTLAPGADPSCSLGTESAAPGASAVVTVHDVLEGAEIRLLFDGSEVARQSADGAAAAAAAAAVDVDMTFVVPGGATPGIHAVVAVGPNFTVACVTASGDGFEVLAASAEQGDDGGSLPRTGIYAALLVAIALALLVVGRSLTHAARARRAKAEADEQPRHRQPAP